MQFIADKDIRKDGFHQGGSDTDKLNIGSRNSQSHIHSQENYSNCPSYGRTEPLDEFFRGENLGESDQFILRRDFFSKFDVMIELNNGLIRIRNTERKYVN